MDGTPLFRVAWQDGEGRLECEAVFGSDEAAERADLQELGLEVLHEGDVWRMVIEPCRCVALVRLSATLVLPLRQADALYLNGYNSWTDSVERRPGDAMPGFGVPVTAVRHWVLDGSGDYRFTPQDARPGHQHGFEYGYLRRGEDVTLFGSLGPDSGFTTIYEDLDASTVTLDKEPPARAVEAGERLEVMGLCVTQGTLGACVERWLGLCGVACRPSRPLVGYTSWYRHYGDISHDVLAHDLAGVAAQLGALDTPGCGRLFQIDDGYAKVGDWLEVRRDRFPQGLAPLADAIRDAGLVAGLWVAPFVCERESELFCRHSDWLLRDEAGQVVPTGSHWSGQVALDTQNEEVRSYVSQVLSTLVQDWGFGFLKCDFLYGACMLPHAGLNRGQLMADALDLVRAAVGEGCLLDFCGVPLASAFGRAEYCRVGCDVGLDWDANWVMRRTGRERVSTKNSLANTRGRAHLDGRAFRVDPDVFFLRDDVRLSRRQREELLDADARLGGMLLTSDDPASWDEWQCEAFGCAVEVFCSRAT